MTAPIETGALARTIRDVPATEHDKALPAGYEFIIEDYVDAETAEDGIPFYNGTSTRTPGNSGDVFVNATEVELVKSAADMAQRRIPSVEELRGFMQYALLSEEDGIEITQTMPTGDDSVEVFGHTADGLHFAAEIKITNLYEADL